MKKRIHVKFRVDMYDDIKCKIIDTKARRDLIHYVLARFIVLAGKVDSDGELYITENMPYTIETLAIEFNRSYEEVEYAISVLNELEIIDISNENTFKVKNWAKHQNCCKKKKVQVENNILVEENKSEKSNIDTRVNNSVIDESRGNNEKIDCEKQSKPNENLNKPYFIENNLTVDKNIENSNKITTNCNPKIKNTNRKCRKNSTDIDKKIDMVPMKELFCDEEVISLFAEDQDDFLKGEGRIIKVFDLT